jgi:lariat debranching enzyme
MDMEQMHCPQKYQKLGNFYEYYNGTRQPYVTTLFIGGNHEAVNYSRELYFGGWAAKGIYYLGQSGSVYAVKGDTRVRITGLSGIFNFKDYMHNRLEPLPFVGSDTISSYHCKQIDIFKLDILAANTTNQFDIFLSHDWPTCTINVI